MSEQPVTVAVLYNQTGEDEYARLREVDPATLDFKPEYNIHVATSEEEYAAVAKALKSEGFRVRLVNVEENLRKLQRSLVQPRPDVVFNLIEHFHDSAQLEMSVAGLYELHRIAYTGAPPFALSLCQRKGLTKQVLRRDQRLRRS
jgi:D-alanine-D-alanine ligase-like ATP-grasp enzyme